MENYIIFSWRMFNNLFSIYMKAIRYDPKNHPYSEAMLKDNLGGFIKYEDYEKLQV